MDDISKFKVGVITVFLISILSLTYSYSFPPTGMAIGYDLDYALNNLDQTKQAYNDNIESIPKFIKTIFGDEKINATITRLDGSIVRLSAETENAMITTLTKNELEEYTLNVWVDEATIDDIKNADNQVERLQQALDDDEIRYDSLRFTTSIKTGLSRIFLFIYGLF